MFMQKLITARSSQGLQPTSSYDTTCDYSPLSIGLGSTAWSLCLKRPDAIFFPERDLCFKRLFQRCNATSCATDRHLSCTLLQLREDIHHRMISLGVMPAVKF